MNPFVEEEKREDGAIVNALTGIGTALDRTESIQVGFSAKLSPQRQEELFLNPIVQNICCAYASEGTRAGWEITLGGDKQNPKLIQDFDNYRAAIGSEDDDDELISDVELVKTAQIWANIYGGAALVLNIDDGQSPENPVDITKIKTIKSVEILDRHRITPDLTKTTNPLRPTHYRILIAARPGDRLNLDNDSKLQKTAKGDYYTYPIHRSRIIRFDGRDGKMLPPDLMSRQGNWGQSSIDAIWDDFKLFENVYHSIGAMIDDASLFVYYAKGLKKQVEGGKEGILRSRFAALRFGAKNLGGAALDFDEEKIEWLSRQFAGLPELSDRFRDRLVVVSGLPTTVILGRGPLGLAAQGTGDAEEQVWERMVNTWQETVLRRKLHRMLRYIWLAKDGPTKGKEPEDWGFTYKPLRVQSEQEKLDVRASASNTYLSYLRDGVLTADEVRNSQFGGSEYSIEIKLDQKAWDEQKKKAEEEANAFGGYDPAAMGLPPEEAAAAPPEEQVVQDSLTQSPVPSPQSLRTDSCGCPDYEQRLRSGVIIPDAYLKDQLTLVRSRPSTAKRTLIDAISQSYPEEILGIDSYQLNPDGSIAGEFASTNGIYKFKYQNGILGYGWNRDSYHADAEKKSRRQGGKVWVEDPSKKGGGYWRKLPKGAKPETPEPEKLKNNNAGAATAIAIGAGIAGTALIGGGVAGAIALSGGFGGGVKGETPPSKPPKPPQEPPRQPRNQKAEREETPQSPPKKQNPSNPGKQSSTASDINLVKDKYGYKVADESSSKKLLDDSLKLIESIHPLGKVKDISIELAKDQPDSFLAAYRFGVDINTGKIVSSVFKINANAVFDGETKEEAIGKAKSTIIHEIGHALDHNFFGGDQFGTGVISENAKQRGEPIPRLKALMNAIDNSASVKGIKSAKNKASRNEPISGWASPTRNLEEYFDYLDMPTEKFARAYAQYISRKLDDPYIKKGITDKIIDGDEAPSQWNDRDFQVIEKEFDKLFRT